MSAAEAKAEDRARQQAQYKAEDIAQLMTALERARETDEPATYEDELLDADALEERAHEMALSVEVRSDWHTPGGDTETGEYLVLLCTGGPAVRLTGNLGAFAEPEDVRIEYQDWFTPWEMYPVDEATSAALLTFAGLFYYAED